MSESTGADKPGLERKDFVAAAAATLVALVAPRVALAGGRDVSALDKGSWELYMEATHASISQSVDQWAANAIVTGAEINGSAVFVAPGTLTSKSSSFVEDVQGALFKAGAPEDVAAAFAGVSWEGWRGWVTGYNMALPDGLRAFAAVPAPEAPDTQLAPIRLREGTTHGRVAMSADAQREALFELLKPRLDEPGAVDAISRYATWYEKSFADWFQHATVQNLTARGPVPSFAPPYVPVGPVVRGVLSGQNVLDAPKFGLPAGS